MDKTLAALGKLVSNYSSGKKKKKKKEDSDDRPSIAERINFGGQFPDKKKKKKRRNSYYESGGMYE